MEPATLRPVLDRVEQYRHYGLDCGDFIRFDAGSWVPGGEHIRQLTVRNVSQRTIKFKYELPRTKFFSMDFPTLITLSPGMSTVLEVAFRPVKLEEYDDFVGFYVQVIEGGVAAVTGRFRVPVAARIAALKIDLPQHLDFGFCPTKETTLQSFTLHNCGQIDALFHWTVPAVGEHGSPFAIQPESGRIQAGERLQLTASFFPTVASVYVNVTSCVVKSDTSESNPTAHARLETMKVSGISKFTHLSASVTELNFGEVLVGAPNTSRAPTEKEFILRNRSLVRASYNIQRLETDHDPTFFFTPLSGVADAESTVTIRVRYAPLSAGTFTCDHFDVLTPGGNRVRITCKGRAIGPMLSVYRKTLESNFVPTTSVNFHDVSVGANAVSRVLTLRNASAVELAFHFDCQSQGVFCFDQIAGKVPSLSDLNITITFSPPNSGNFYRRIFLLVHNQSTQFVDVLGTGYDEKMRPSPFEQAHVDAYRFRAAAGLGRLSPDQLETYREKNGDAMFLKGALQRFQSEEMRVTNDTDSTVSQIPSPGQILTRSGEALLAEVDICREYFISIEDDANAVFVRSAFFDFESCSIVQMPSKKLLFVTNNTRSKVTCSWHIAVTTGLSDPSAFQVFPSSSDIATGATVEFRVVFQPSRINTYYFAEFEAFVSFKSNRTFRLVNVDTFTPPWSLIVKACGNTFSSLTEQFLPQVNFKLVGKKVHFPPCYLGDSVFQTVMIENSSDTSALYHFVEDPSGTFSCKPIGGFIEPNSFHLVAIRFTPCNAQKYSCFLKCVVNNNKEKPHLLELSAICALPQLSFQDIEAGQLLPFEAKVYLKPTSIGLQSVRQIQLVNTSRVPLVYRCELPPKHHNVFRVNPKLGRLNGRESAMIDCVFTPDEIREYVCRIIVAVKSISVPLLESKSFKSKIPILQELTIRVQTKGTTGAILFQPETLKFETILVNSSSKQMFFIENTADCDLKYSLQQDIVAGQQREMNEVVTSEEKKTLPRSGKLVFSHAEGYIPAQSRKKITAVFSSTSAGLYTFKVLCVVGNQTANSSYYSWDSDKLKQATCIIQAEASFPTVEIQDLRVPGLSTQLAWHQFQCNEINEYLAASPTKQELSHATAINESTYPECDEFDDEISIKRFALPFSPAPLGNRTEKVFMMLKNPGSLIVQYRLRLPNEGTVEMEHWAETGAPSAADVRLNGIISSKVFDFFPRHATLLPHQSILLTLSYSYNSEAFDGEHNLPLFLEVEKGKTVVLELQGQTLAHKYPKLYLPTQVFYLSPVTIGEFRQNFMPRCHEQDKLAQICINKPPVQQLEVFNRGESAMRLEVGKASFSRVNTANYGYRVLACESQSRIIPARSSIFLNIEFNPIKVGTIQAPLLFKACGLMGKGYSEISEVTVIGTGYHPKKNTMAQIKCKVWPTVKAPPKKQACRIPNLPACFVSDYVDFGHVSMHSEVSQLLVLKNENDASSSDVPRRFVFEWDTMHPLVINETIVFSPKSGELKPGEKALIRVTVVARGDAVVVDHDVAIMITYSDDCKDTPGNNADSKSAIPPRGQHIITDPSLNRNRDTKTRMSIIHRSTATQKAVIDKHEKLPALERSKNPSITRLPLSKTQLFNSRQTLIQPSRNVFPPSSNDINHLDMIPVTNPTRLFVRIFAHILPENVMERIYPRNELNKMPLPTTKQIPHVVSAPDPAVRDVAIPSFSNTRATSKKFAASAALSNSESCSKICAEATNEADPGVFACTDEAAAAECQDVLYDVMETLAMDVLTSSTIQDALKEQLVPLPRSDCALLHATFLEGAQSTLPPESLYHSTRQDIDCQAIVANLMENTVFNTLQELFYGDLEQELLCVPRSSLFPEVVGSSVSKINKDSGKDSQPVIT
ncbi:putative immunoglobulin-like protein [Plasmopara halstedii]